LEERRPDRITRYAVYGMVALENGVGAGVFPAQFWRGLVGASVALELPRLGRAWFGPGATTEIALVVGHESDHELANGPALDLTPPYGIPFGGGGDFLAPDAAFRARLTERLTLAMRVQDRLFTNAFPLLASAREASDTVADYLHEAFFHAPAIDVVLRYRAGHAVEPLLSLFAEHGFAREHETRDAVLVRALAGPAIVGPGGELVVFVAAEAGNGKGLLINRREERLSLGVRYAIH
jgi:hypothetical protein